MKKKLIVAAFAVAAIASTALAATNLGPLLQWAKLGSVPTCSAFLEGSVYRGKGGANEGYTKTCTCVSDGAASPAYLWCSTQFAAGAATTTCAGGNATTCP